jgi:HD-GYP domain-containing protein (c-di-GMP phosphodiesterase class II)
MSARYAPWPRAVTEARSEIANSLVSGIAPHEQTLIVQLLAHSFVDTYASALLQSRPDRLVSWVDKMCDAHADTPAVARLFDSACRSMDAFFAEHHFSETYRFPLRSLSGSLQETVEKPREAFSKAPAQINEVDAAISRAVARLDRADPLTAEHSRAVGVWCARLARRLTLSEKDVMHVARCGLIHDIGKSTTPPDILNAPRSLSDEEWAVMRSHTLAGEALASADSQLGSFRAAIRNHHERPDGRGYPDRLEAEGISLYIRIVTVADCFNAMIGRRPYRPPMRPALALEQLDRNTGTQFDPDVVAAMHAVLGQ